MLLRPAPDEIIADVPETPAEYVLRRLGPLVHQMSNQLQYAVGEGDLLAEKARARDLAFDVRQDIASLLDRLDGVVGTVQRVQATLREARGGLTPPSGGVAGR